MDLKNYRRRKETLEFAVVLEQKLKGVDSTPYKIVRL
jgi:hypothetical protein